MLRPIPLYEQNFRPEEAEGQFGPGALDGMTLMRYAHIDRLRTSGGVEQYLHHLDRGLLRRHRLTVIQMHLTQDASQDSVEVESVGQGRILWVPVPFRQADSRIADLPNRIGCVYEMSKRCAKQQDGNAGNAILSTMFRLLRNGAGHLRYKTAVLSDRLENVLAGQQVSLLALHWFSYDTNILIRSAMRMRVPFVVINHFDNERMSAKPVRRWLDRAAGIGTVSSRNVPESVRERYVNLSDAVDTDFFNPARTHATTAARPIIFLPARIDVGKGHLDLMRAARILHGWQIDFQICFAGAVDSASLENQLRRFALESGMEDQILFLGEMTAENLREWYAKSSMVILPSYSEGLGRVLVEAQSMEKPVIAYAAGGTPDAIMAGVTGFLVKPGDIQELARNMRFLLGDKAEGRRMGERGREFVSRTFSVSDLIRRHEAFYVSALSKRRS
jgi:glycosyltransferase involved in cell wall biosynthesis